MTVCDTVWPVGHSEGRNLEVPEAAERNLRPQESGGRERNVVWVVWVNSCHQFFMSSPLHQNRRRRRREGKEAIGWEGRQGKGREGKGMLLHLPSISLIRQLHH